MNKLSSIFLLAFLAITLVACNKEYIGDYDSNYIGAWHSAPLTTSLGQREIYFNIDGKNSQYGFMCEINCSSCQCELLTSGKALINKDYNKLIIGSGDGKKQVKINIKTHPYQNNLGKWECVIKNTDGTDIIMYKQ